MFACVSASSTLQGNFTYTVSAEFNACPANVEAMKLGPDELKGCMLLLYKNLPKMRVAEIVRHA